MTEPEDTNQAEAAPARGRAHHKLALAIIAVASILSLLAIFAVWANRQLLNTDNWTETSSELIENDAIRTQVSTFLVDELYTNVDVKGELEQVFEQVLRPAGASTLAGPAAGGLRTLAERGVDTLLERPVPQQVWENANRRAHKRLLFVVEGGGDVLSTSGGDVTLDLSALLSQTQSNLGVGGRVQERLPEGAAQIVLFRSSQLELAQDGVRLLKTLAIVFVALALVLFALAVFLARGWRREALRACGAGLLFAGAAALVARGVAGGAVVDALATTEAVRPAAEATWSIGSSLLEEVATATLIYGVVIVLAAWLAGPTTWAVGTRRGLAPYLREPRYAWGAFAVIVLILLAWAPTPAFRIVIPALILIGLLAVGVEALRRQTMREFPDADHRESNERLRRWVSGLSRRARGGATPADSRLDELERLGRMRDSGVLDASEYAAEKARLLAHDSPTA
jgi:Short C-terminal domain